MTQVLGEAVLALRTDESGLDKGISSAKAKAAKLSTSLTSAGKKLTLGLTAPLVAFAAFGVKMASDLGESMNKASEVFGDAVSSVTTFADTSATQFGISEKAALEYAGTLGTILNASGLTEQASADMSVQMVKLAADLASFNNIPIDVALEKIRSGLVGEVEPLRTVGVLLNQAAVEAKAVELGLIGVDDELTEAAKVQARYALILEQTQTQQGDFGRTSDTLANAMRILKAEVTDVAGELFSALVPIITRGIQVARDLTHWFGQLSDPMKNIVLVSIGVVAAIGPLLIAFGKIITAASIIGPALTALATGPAAPFVLIGVAVAALAVLIATHWDEIKAFTLQMVQDVTTFIGNLPDEFNKVVDRIGQAVQNLYLQIKQWLVDKLTALIAPFTTAWNTIVSLFQTGTESVQKSTSQISEQAASGMQHGGVISAPSVLYSAGAVTRVAEASAEAVMPLTRLPSGDLGVKAAGAESGGGGDIYIDLHIADSVIASAETARRLLIPVIEEAADKLRTRIMVSE